MSARSQAAKPRLGWALAFAWLSLLVIWLAQYRVFYFWPPLVGGDAWGLAFGIAGTIALVLSAFYSLRKVHLTWWIGSLERWFEIHIYLGALALVLIVAHSGYRFHATVPNLALLFLFLEVASGLLGWALYLREPSRKAGRLKAPVLPAITAERLSEIHQKLSEICSGRGKPFLDLYNDLVIPLYRTRGREPETLPPAPPLETEFEFGQAEDFQAALKLIEEAKSLFQGLNLHLRFLRRLRLWLYVHVPISVALVTFSTAHILSVLWY